ncbi:MAG: alcohol dehydrogenase catalytic domain-containing protein [Anaerolineaceae bacterium]|nr:alcohol dehydrogenase catalytic domain-containing protein [Anaerolineaceae bacterium]
MKALLVTGVGQVALCDLPMPELRPYEALVKVEACGICNSTDHKLIMGTFVPGPFPTALGHESVGKIVRLGEKVRHFAEGQRVLRTVLFDRHVPGGRSTWGGFAEYAVVVDGQAMGEDGSPDAAHWSAAKQQIVPESVTPAQAAAMITVKETLSTLQNLGVTAGSSVAVVGSGPVAQAFAFEARLLGADPVVVFGRRKEWAERFAELGIQDYVTGEDWPDAVAQRAAGKGFDYVVEAVGSSQALTKALRLAGTQGKVGLYGVPPADDPWIPAERNHPRVSMPRVEEADVHQQMLDWVAQGKINLDDWYTAAIPWSDYEKGFQLVAQNHAAKIILVME